jgi:hypothetical protein
MPWHHACPANRDGKCAFKQYHEYCQRSDWEQCFSNNNEWNPRIEEYNKNGKTIRVITHVTDENWRWGSMQYKNNMKLPYLKDIYG